MLMRRADTVLVRMGTCLRKHWIARRGKMRRRRRRRRRLRRNA
jgi:hypothetical protein